MNRDEKLRQELKKLDAERKKFFANVHLAKKQAAAKLTRPEARIDYTRK